MISSLLPAIGLLLIFNQEVPVSAQASSCRRCDEPKNCSRIFVNKEPTKDLDSFYERSTTLFNQGGRSQELRDELNAIITEGHKNLSYDCVWSALAITDAALDPEDSTTKDDVMLFYSQQSIPRLCRVCQRTLNEGDNWNREHTWPASRGFKNKGRIEHNDIHHLVPTDASINGKGRNNRDFGEGGQEFKEGSSDRECKGCLITGTQQNGTWEAPNAVKGQVARMMLYMDVRYENLELVPEKIAKNNKEGRLGNLTTLLKWHCDNDVVGREKTRNDKVENLQGNRNPFIDRPEFAKEIWPEYFDSIWSKGCKWEKEKEEDPKEEDPKEEDPKEEDPKEEDPKEEDPKQPTSIWINEFHYDNVGSDRNEFVEIACNQEINLSGYQIILVNGSNGQSYKTITLSETCVPDTGFIARSDVSPIQNGRRDGIALVEPDGNIVEFISYEGTVSFRGRRSLDIGVSENSSTPRDESLQKIGVGCVGSDFMWRRGTTKASRGRINADQTIDCGGGRDEL